MHNTENNTINASQLYRGRMSGGGFVLGGLLSAGRLSGGECPTFRNMGHGQGNRALFNVDIN